MLGSRWLGAINEKQQVPIVALIFNFAIMFIIGCIYLGSTSAFNAFINTGLILQHVTYAFPALLLMLRGRSSQWLPPTRSFKMPSIVGWMANSLTVAFAIFALVFYDFPTVMPVTSSNMSKSTYDRLMSYRLTLPDYTSAVIGVMAIFAIANWFGHARKSFHGPRLQTVFS